MIQPLTPDGDARKDWRTTNQVIAALQGETNSGSRRDGTLARLERRRRDSGSVSGDLELTDCATGQTYIVAGQLVPPP